jgi:hypothetical protein
MILTEDQLTAAVLDKLFYAAAEYGARITVRAELGAEPPPHRHRNRPRRRPGGADGAQSLRHSHPCRGEQNRERFAVCRAQASPGSHGSTTYQEAR